MRSDLRSETGNFRPRSSAILAEITWQITGSSMSDKRSWPKGSVKHEQDVSKLTHNAIMYGQKRQPPEASPTGQT